MGRRRQGLGLVQGQVVSRSLELLVLGVRSGSSDGGGYARTKSAGNIANNIEPLLGFCGAVGLELQLRGARQLAADALRLVLTLDIELVVLGSADNGIGQVDAKFGLGVLALGVVVLELVEVPGRGDDVVAGVVAPRELVARLAVKRALDERLGRGVISVGNQGKQVTEFTRRFVLVDEKVGTANPEFLPLKVGRDVLGGLEHLGVETTNMLGMATGERVQVLHGLLDALNNLDLEFHELGLGGDEFGAMIVFILDLVMEAVDDALAKNIRIIGRIEVGAARRKRGNVLGKQLDMLLSRVAGLLDRLSSLVQAVREPL